MIRGKNKKIQALSSQNDKKNHLQSNKQQPLLYQTQQIEQKLSFLKEKIAEKKKISMKENNKTQQQKQLHNFLKKIGLGQQYQNLLIQNGIDSFDILKEAKQTQLEEIGILKGHALKIMVNIKKQEKQVTASQKISQPKTTKSKQEEQDKKAESLATTETIGKNQGYEMNNIQTDSIPLQTSKMIFCLYCFQRSQFTYCSMKCQQLYNAMFERYESNLQKAQESFTHPVGIVEREKENNEELSDNQQFLESFDFLFKPKQEDFNEEEYQMMKELMKK